jgi:hypothetical protein
MEHEYEKEDRLFLSPLNLNPYQPLRQLTLKHWLPQLFFLRAVRGFVFVSQQDGGGDGPILVEHILTRHTVAICKLAIVLIESRIFVYSGLDQWVQC